MKIRFLLLTAFVCLQSYFSLAADPAFGSLRALAKLWIPGNSNNNYFGSSVAISEDGNTVVVGAYAVGEAYVYVKPAGGWQTTQHYAAKLTNGLPGTPFGYSVAISGDTIVVSMNLGLQGAAFVFEKPVDGWHSTSNYEAMLTSRLPEAGNMAPVAIYGGTIVAGFVPTEDNVGVGVFVKPKGGWKSGTETAVLAATDLPAGSDFGSSLAIQGDTIIVGNFVDGPAGPGSAYIYVKPQGGWANSTQTAELTPSDGTEWEEFGMSVAFDGETAIVGAPGYNVGSGAAYVFTKPSSGWQSMMETAKLTASNGYSDSGFGNTVAIRGRIAVVGAQLYDDATYLYVESKDGWQSTSSNEELPPPRGLYVNGPFAMGGTLLVTRTNRGETTKPSPSEVVVYGIE
jgi:hypothetical protein